jgi:hypothetical protein
MKKGEENLPIWHNEIICEVMMGNKIEFCPVIPQKKQIMAPVEGDWD